MISLPEVLREYQSLRDLRDRGLLGEAEAERLSRLEAWLAESHPETLEAGAPKPEASPFAADIPEIEDIPFADEADVLDVELADAAGGAGGFAAAERPEVAEVADRPQASESLEAERSYEPAEGLEEVAAEPLQVVEADPEPTGEATWDPGAYAGDPGAYARNPGAYAGESESGADADDGWDPRSLTSEGDDADAWVSEEEALDLIRAAGADRPPAPEPDFHVTRSAGEFTGAADATEAAPDPQPLDVTRSAGEYTGAADVTEDAPDPEPFDVTRSAGDFLAEQPQPSVEDAPATTPGTLSGGRDVEADTDTDTDTDADVASEDDNFEGAPEPIALDDLDLGDDSPMELADGAEFLDMAVEANTEAGDEAPSASAALGVAQAKELWADGEAERESEGEVDPKPEHQPGAMAEAGPPPHDELETGLAHEAALKPEPESLEIDLDDTGELELTTQTVDFLDMAAAANTRTEPEDGETAGDETRGGVGFEDHAFHDDAVPADTLELMESGAATFDDDVPLPADSLAPAEGSDDGLPEAGFHVVDEDDAAFPFDADAEAPLRADALAPTDLEGDAPIPADALAPPDLEGDAPIPADALMPPGLEDDGLPGAPFLGEPGPTGALGEADAPFGGRPTPPRSPVDESVDVPMDDAFDSPGAGSALPSDPLADLPGEDVEDFDDLEFAEVVEEAASQDAAVQALPNGPVAAGSHLAPVAFVDGEHRVVVHLTQGPPRRGRLIDADLEADVLHVWPLVGSGDPQPLPQAKIRAVFFLLGPGEAPVPAEGPRVEVRFAPGREMRGRAELSPEEAPGFFMIPDDATRSNVNRIYVYRDRVPVRMI